MKGHQSIKLVIGSVLFVCVLALFGFSAASANTVVEVDINGRVIGSDVNVGIDVDNGHSTPPTTSPPPPVWGDHDVPPSTTKPAPTTKPQNRPPTTKAQSATPPTSLIVPEEAAPAPSITIPLAVRPKGNTEVVSPGATMGPAVLIEQGEIGPGPQTAANNGSSSSGLSGVPFPFIGDGSDPRPAASQGVATPMMPRSINNTLAVYLLYGAAALICVLIFCVIMWYRTSRQPAYATAPPPPSAAYLARWAAAPPPPPD